MTLDTIQLLRDERPDSEHDDALRADAMYRAREQHALRTPPPRRRRAGRRTALVVALAGIAVLSGIAALDRTGGDSGTLPSISTAEAVQIATDALARLEMLDDYDLQISRTQTEVGGEHHVYGIGSHSVVIGSDTSWTRWSRNDHRGQPRLDAAEQRRAGGRLYEEAMSNELDQSWLIDIKDQRSDGQLFPTRDTAQERRMNMMFGNIDAAPDFTALVEQLERERLVDARRETNGDIVVEVQRPAIELAPAGNISSAPIDPLTMFAWGLAREHPRTLVTARIVVSDGGSLRRVRISARYDAPTHTGSGKMEDIDSDVVHEWRLTPVGDRAIAVPKPTDVAVVGDAMMARRGATGIAGSHGTLDEFTPAELEALHLRVLRTPQSEYLPARPVRPARRYPDLMRRRAANYREVLAILATIDLDDRRHFAADENCTPFWPQSGRVMHPDEGRRSPDTVGWRCDLGTDVGIASIRPNSNQWDVEYATGAGASGIIAPKR